MPDLAISSVLDWVRHDEPDRPEFLEEPMTSTEAHPEVDAILVRLGLALDEAIRRDPVGLAAQLKIGTLRDDLGAVMGQLGCPRVLRLLAWLIRAGLPENDTILAAVLAPGPSGAGQYLQATLAAAARPALLERIYSPDRLAILVAACELDNGPRRPA